MSSITRTRFGLIVGTTAALLVSVVPSTAPAVATEEPVPPFEIERVIDSPSPDIVGGSEATPGEYPFAVDIRMSIYASYWGCDQVLGTCGTYWTWFSRQCAGTLIESEWVLTAAHCFNPVEVQDSERPYGTFRGPVEVADLTLHIGRHDTGTSNGEALDASAIYVHPDYAFDTRSPYDIALVRLEGPSVYQPVDLATAAETGLYASGTVGTAVGWGHTSSGGSSSSVLMEVEIPTLSDDSCSFILGADFHPAIELCAGDIYDGGEDTCQGDSGGPFLVPSGSGWTQAGITSWGIGCGTIVPAVYTEVAGFQDWINETIALTPLHDIEAHDPMFTSTSDYVVYWEAPTALNQTLYSAPTDAGSPTALSPAVFGRAPVLAITNDGKTVVYGVSEDEFAYGSTMDLFAVPVEGPMTSRVLLGDDLPFFLEVILHPDNASVLYELDEQVFRVDLATGTSSVLSPTATNPDSQIVALEVTSDGKYAVWQGDPTVDGRRELTVADLSTGATWTLASFDSPDIFSGMVENWLLTPDGSRVVYTARVDEFTHGMYSVPVTGTVGDEILIGDVETLHYFSTEIAPYGEWWAITDDSQRVMYYRERPVTEGLYSVPVTGSPADEVALLTGIDLGDHRPDAGGPATPADGAERSFNYRSNYDDVQFAAAHVVVETPSGVLSIPATGPESAAQNLGIGAGDAWQVSPRGDFVTFIEGGESGPLGLVPIGGSAADIQIISDDDVDAVVWSADGSHFAYTEAWSGDLFWVAVDGDRTAVELARTRTRESSGADTVAVSPDGKLVVYVADVRWPDVRETWLASPYGPRYLAGESVSGDFSGDGKTDVAMYDAGTGLWSVGVSTGTSTPLVAWSDVPVTGWDTVLVGDYNGDGRDDIAMYVNATGHWWVSVSDGAGFSTSSWSKFTGSLQISSQYVGDYNGDGLDDLANFEVSTGKWWVSVSLPGQNRFGTSTWSKFTASLELPTQLIGDINGDGLDDLANYHLDSGKWFLSLSDGTKFLTYVGADGLDGREFFNQFIGDFNGDGRDDLASYDNVSGEWLISLSQGTSLADPVQWSRFTSSIVITDQFIGDFNGDGNADVANFEVTTGKWWMSLGAPDQGRFLTSTWSKFTPSLVLDPQLIGDLNGDGMDDLLNYLPASRRWFGSISTGTSFATYILGDA